MDVEEIKVGSEILVLHTFFLRKTLPAGLPRGTYGITGVTPPWAVGVVAVEIGGVTLFVYREAICEGRAATAALDLYMAFWACELEPATRFVRLLGVFEP